MSLFKQNSKKGLSLITVLLFMLVATLAATGVFKWLSTQNKASASRLMQSEVYQASQAGIETARSWMVYHGHEVGALIKQYKDDNRKPVLLDSILHPLASNKNQKFSVLLVGADTKSYPYKLKLISTGMSRSGSKYSQVAIVSVDGLYRVSIPLEQSNIDFDKAFFGKVDKLVGSDQMQSAIINGNYGGNVPKIEESLLITGNAALQGTVDLAGADFYVKGDFSNQGAVTIGSTTSDTNVAYFGGNLTNCAGGALTIHGDAYFNGDVNENCQISVSGNATFNGTLNRNNSGNLFYVGKNLIFTPTGKLNLKASGGMSFTVEQNTISPAEIISPQSSFIMTWGEENSSEVWMNSMASYLFGFTVTGYYGYDNYNIHNGVITNYLAKFKTKGQIKGKTSNPDDLRIAWGVDYSKMNALGNLITAADTVPTPILLKNKAEWMAKEASSLCGVSASFSNNEDNTVNKLNACYANFRDNDPDKLFNGFLVVELTTNANYGSSQLLDGKFIFILTGTNRQKLPATKSDAVVMLYLPNGGTDFLPNSPTEFYKYFIYSEGNITQLMEWSGKSISGSLIMAAGSTLGQSQGGSALKYDGDVIKALADAGVIEGNPEFSERVIPDSTTLTSVSSAGQDAFYISTTPRLRIRLESQYVNKELDVDTLSSSSYAVLSPSILVMPRTIYLTKNAAGSLDQYYSVLNLNGATENPSSGTVTCSPSGMNTSGSLGTLSGGIYNCKYTPGNSSYNDCPFYVVVEGVTNTLPKVYFKDYNIPLTTGESTTIFLKVSPGSGTLKMLVRVTNDYSWSFTPMSGVTLIGPDLYEITINANTSEQTVPVFTDVSGAGNSIKFELASASGAMVWHPDESFAYIEGSATVNRESLTNYLNQYTDAPDKDSVEKWKDYPDCVLSGASAWVQAKEACVSTTVNESWSCPVLGTSLYLDKAFLVDGCAAYIPNSDLNKVINPEVDSTYTLYADLKANPYDLIVKTKGSNSKVTIHVKDSLSRVSEEYVFLNSGEKDTIQVFHGINYKITATSANNEDHFNYWICKTASGEDCAIPSFRDPTYPLSPYKTGDTLIAYFNERNNCFTESFEGLQEDCSASESVRCIDECASGNACSVEGGEYSTSDWMMVYANNNNDFVKLDIVDGANQDAYAGFGDKPVFILKPVVAGYEGVYTAQIRAYPKNSIMSNQSLNTGLVFRSNATGTSYFTLSVLSKKKDNTDLLRVCYATDAHIGSESQCISKGDALSTWTGSNLDQMETYTVKATLLGDRLYVTVLDSKGEIYIPETVFNLKDSKFNASGVSASQNEYVGFKLYGDHFRLYSMTWDSKTYLCFEKPQFYCSFKANYAGGRIPANEDVTPWAYVSNFCNENEACCDYTYYPSAPMQFDAGNYPEDHVKASASCVRDGETKVFDTIPCGAFTVGDRIPCVEDIMIPTSSGYCSGYGNCEVSLDKISNLRDAVLNFDLTLNGGADTISVYFIDVKGIQSQAGGYLMTSGSYSLPVLDFIDVDMFDPERITKVIFKSENGLSFDVNNLRSICSNTLKLSDCDVTYNGTKLTFKANVANAGNCSISGPSVSKTGISCDGSWTYTYNYPVDSSSYAGQTITLNITANNTLDPSITKTCSDTVMIKAPSGNCSWSPPTLTATATGSAQFTANFTDCPASGCAYEIKNHNNIVVATGTGIVGTATFNTPKAVGDYTYTAIVNGNEVCNDDLKVMAGAAPIASCGGVSPSGEFTASVTDNDFVGWSYQVVVTDNIGNTIHTSATSATTTGSGSISYTGYSPSVSGTYTYTLKLNGEVKCSSTLRITGSITSCTLSPTTINASDNVTFRAKTNKIANGTSCEIKDASGGSPSGLASNIVINNNECSSTFNPTQTGTYTVYIGGYNRRCGTVTVNVSSSSVVASSSSAAGCAYQSSWCNGIDFSNVLILPSGTYDNNCGGVTCPPGATDYNANKCFFIKSPCSVYQNVSSTHAADGGCYAYRSGSNWWKVNGGTGGNPSCGGTVTPSSSSVVVSSSSSGFACNDLNSKTLAKEEVSAYSAGNCFKYTKGATSNLQVGVWWCPSPPSIMNIQKCDGSIVQISHGCNNWVAVPITGSCAIYLQTIGNGGDIKFNDW